MSRDSSDDVPMPASVPKRPDRSFRSVYHFLPTALSFFLPSLFVCVVFCTFAFSQLL